MIKPPATFPGLQDLLDPGSGGGVDMRPTLLRVLTDLYLQRTTHTPEDETYYTELALRLIDAADISQRAALAKRLAFYPSAPRPVIERLARDPIEVAAPILQHSSCLTLSSLESIAEDCGRAHAEVIAGRAAPPSRVHPSPVARQGAASELVELFYAAGCAERRLILISLDYATFAPAMPVYASSEADLRQLESAALKHNKEAVARELECALGLSRAQTRRMLNDEWGEPIVAAAKAMNVPGQMLQRMLLFINPRVGHSIGRVFELADLYSEISIVAARRLIAIWRDVLEGDEKPARDETMAWRTAAEKARRALSHVSRRPELQHASELHRREG